MKFIFFTIFNQDHHPYWVLNVTAQDGNVLHENVLHENGSVLHGSVLRGSVLRGGVLRGGVLRGGVLHVRHKRIAFSQILSVHPDLGQQPYPQKRL